MRITFSELLYRILTFLSSSYIMEEFVSKYMLSYILSTVSKNTLYSIQKTLAYDMVRKTYTDNVLITNVRNCTHRVVLHSHGSRRPNNTTLM